MATKNYTEKAFEEAIEDSLFSNGGYVKGNAEEFDKELSLDKNRIIDFLKTSQPDEWKRISEIHGTETERKIIERICKELELNGTLSVVRKGFTDYGVKFKMAYFRPETSLNPDTERLYSLNQLTVKRQIKYSLSNSNSIDLLICLNGLPIITIEIKNQFTGQTVEDAKTQYKSSRDSKEILFQFKKRALVHFALDTDEVFMTTKIDGSKTKYLPFNLGHNNGAGNPPIPNNYKTAYLWEYVLTKDSILDIVGRYLHLQVDEFKFGTEVRKRESLIFPRYHQLDVVRKIIKDVKSNGAGKDYLIEHSAGSGKSNSIAWLSHHLSTLHNTKNEKVFDSVIVITDRKVLDKQLQGTIYQFEHKEGVVKKIDESSTQLGEALQKGVPVIITTLQKFPFVNILDNIENLPLRNYAIIVDEAHSSQGGEATKKLKEVLTTTSLEEAEKEEKEVEGDDAEDNIRKSMNARGKHKNLSFFAFTATPKPKTLEVFGEKDKNGLPQPFHLYSMRQAIQEGFILDVLKNYTTYKTFYELSKNIQDDPLLNKRKAAQAIGKFVSFHPTNLSQKTQVIIEHFRQIVSKKIGGLAKAMVVTSSRLHAVKYKLEFDRYLREKGYTEIKALVAFSGKVVDEDKDNPYTEAGMNGFPETELPEKFSTNEYQILLVADKYQYGYDQPLLHTMYVDKRLSGVRAVQTLSRLNRMHSGKEDTFVLDFVNDSEEIYNSFKPYYEVTEIEKATDPNLLYDLKNKIEEKGIIWQTEIENFCNVYYKSANRLSVKDHSQLNSYIDPAVDRFKGIEKEEDKEDFKNLLQSFTRLYSFLSQIIPFRDIELEKLYSYGRFLYTKLPKRDLSGRIKLDDDVALEYYRLQRINEEHINLEKDEKMPLKPVTEAGIRKEKEDKIKLSELISLLNDRYGTEFTDADKLFFEQIQEELMRDESLNQQAMTNPIENFKYPFNDVYENKLIDRMEQNQEIFSKLMNDKDFGEFVKVWMLDSVYRKIKGQSLNP